MPHILKNDFNLPNALVTSASFANLSPLLILLPNWYKYNAKKK